MVVVPSTLPYGVQGQGYALTPARTHYHTPIAVDHGDARRQRRKTWAMVRAGVSMKEVYKHSVLIPTHSEQDLERERTREKRVLNWLGAGREGVRGA